MKILKKAVAELICIAATFGLFCNCFQKSYADVAVTRGDINGDRNINVIDKLYLKQYIINGSKKSPVTNWRKAMDVNGDGQINAADILMLDKYVLQNNLSTEKPKKIDTYDGIDVSRWQGDINWSKVKEAGIDFVMIKAGEGTAMESMFLKNINGAKAAGIQCGIYWFANARCVQDAHVEAQACMNVIKNYKLEYPVVYDFEYRTLDNGNPLANNRALCTETINTFLHDLEAGGYYAMVYTNKDFPQRYLNIDDITSRFALWYANYSISQPDVKCSIWQYSCKGKVDGILYDVDKDISYVDFQSQIISAGLNGFTEEDKKKLSSSGKTNEFDPDVTHKTFSELMKSGNNMWSENSLKLIESDSDTSHYQGSGYGTLIDVWADTSTKYITAFSSTWGKNETKWIKENNLFSSNLKNDIINFLVVACDYETSEAQKFIKQYTLNNGFDVTDSYGNRIVLTVGETIQLHIDLKK